MNKRNYKAEGELITVSDRLYDLVRVRTKPLDEIMGSDVPRGLSADDIATDSNDQNYT
jgi:hypothetical protein